MRPPCEKKELLFPRECFRSCAYKNIEVIAISHLLDLVRYLKKEKRIEPTKNNYYCNAVLQNETIDFKEVKGQQTAQGALQITAAERHNILFVGSPGSGKTMLAQRLASIFPPMTFEEILETSKIYSVSGKLDNKPLVT